MHAFVAHGSMIEEKGWGIPVEESVHAWLSYTAWSLMDDSNMQAYIKDINNLLKFIIEVSLRPFHWHG